MRAHLQNLERSLQEAEEMAKHAEHAVVRNYFELVADQRRAALYEMERKARLERMVWVVFLGAVAAVLALAGALLWSVL